MSQGISKLWETMSIMHILRENLFKIYKSLSHHLSWMLNCNLLKKAQRIEPGEIYIYIYILSSVPCVRTPFSLLSVCVCFSKKKKNVHVERIF